MNQKKDPSEIDPEFIKKLIEENDRPKKSDLKNTAIAKEIKAHQRYEVKLIADVLGVSRSSLYYETVESEEAGMAHYDGSSLVHIDGYSTMKLRGRRVCCQVICGYWF